MEKIWYKNIIDKSDGILGICLVFNGYKAFKHNHKEDETYFFLYGTGKMFCDNKTFIVNSPDIIKIKGNDLHCMTPISEYVILMYYFKQGPFDKIKYNYTLSKL